MIGARCFIDHMGPAIVDERGLGVAPHPHIGLQTVTWPLAGEALHRDSLGTEQVIAPGQLNLMTAGHGVSHSEKAPATAVNCMASSSGSPSPTTPDTSRPRSNIMPTSPRSSSTTRSPPS